MAAAIFAACAASNPPSAVAQTMQPLIDDGYECTVPPENENSLFGQWTCDKNGTDGVAYHVVIDGNDAGVRQVVGIVDQSSQTTPMQEPAIHLFDMLARASLGGPTEDILPWIDEHLTSGGEEQFGQVFVTVDALQPVTHLSLFVSE